METVVAVIGLPDAPGVEPEAGVPKAEMHEPTVMSEVLPGTVWLNAVVEV
jgi:hypothetical protein